MDYENSFILQKNVNWSLMNEGFAIPVSTLKYFNIWNPSILQHGASKPIKILIDGIMYDAVLKNQNFDKNKYSKHRDIIQVRYTTNSEIAKKIRACFPKSYQYIFAQRQLEENKGKIINLPDNIHEYFRLFLTSNSDVLAMECYSDENYKQLSYILKDIPEEVYEVNEDDRFFYEDKAASIEEKMQLVKYRKIDRSIISMLKKFYDYRDEITGEKVGEEYGESVVEAHHIDYFTKSQNNDSTNIIIISPNNHRIIHRNNPHFNRKKYQFEFPNGEIMPLKLYDHLIL